MIRVLQVLSLLAIAIGASQAAYAAESLPGEACTAEQENYFLRVGGNEIPGGHFIVCKSGAWRSILSWDDAAAVTKIGNLTCTSGQVLKWSGTAWTCAADDAGTAGITALTGDVTASGSGSVVATIADNAVTAAKTDFVGTLTEGKWCTVSGGKIVCTEDAPSGGGGGLATRNYQAFTASGTWTKPAGADMVTVECWGAGGAGGKQAGTMGGAGGGGGGAYASAWFVAANLTDTVDMTIATGPAGRTSTGTGTSGGTSSFGSYLSASGGAGGAGDGSAGNGGASTTIASTKLDFDTVLGASGGTGAGAMGTGTCTAGAKNRVAAGGGGGAGKGTGGSTACAGGAAFYGGNGGAGNVSGAATAGVAPGGGGGGSAASSGASGAGARGECRVTTIVR